MGFHGTNVQLPVGGKILSSAKTRHSVWPQSRSDRTYFMEHESGAWLWAEHAHSKTSDPDPASREVVYETQPLGSVEYDQNLPSNRSARTVPEQRITGRIDIPRSESWMNQAGPT